jgi:hypothetical protein
LRQVLQSQMEVIVFSADMWIQTSESWRCG